MSRTREAGGRDKKNNKKEGGWLSSCWYLKETENQGAPFERGRSGKGLNGDLWPHKACKQCSTLHLWHSSAVHALLKTIDSKDLSQRGSSSAGELKAYFGWRFFCINEQLLTVEKYLWGPVKILPHGQTNPVHSIVQWYSRSQSWNKEAPLLFRRHNWVSWHYCDFFCHLSVRPMPCIISVKKNVLTLWSKTEITRLEPKLNLNSDGENVWSTNCD